MYNLVSQFLLTESSYSFAAKQNAVILPTTTTTDATATTTITTTTTTNVGK